MSESGLSGAGDVWADDLHEHEDDVRVQTELERDWESRRSQFWNAGYREGLEEGKVKYIKDGFFNGFAEGTDLGFRLGAARGMLHTVSHPVSPLEASAATSSTDVSSLKQDLDAVSKKLTSPSQGVEAIHEVYSTGGAVTSSDPGRDHGADPSSLGQISRDCGGLLSKAKDALQAENISLLASQSDVVNGGQG